MEDSLPPAQRTHAAASEQSTPSGYEKCKHFYQPWTVQNWRFECVQSHQGSEIGEDSDWHAILCEPRSLEG